MTIKRIHSTIIKLIAGVHIFGVKAVAKDGVCRVTDSITGFEHVIEPDGSAIKIATILHEDEAPREILIATSPVVVAQTVLELILKDRVNQTAVSLGFEELAKELASG